MKLQLSNRANTNLLHIEKHTVDEWGPRQWVIYSAYLEQAFETLRTFPAIGLRPVELEDGIHAFRVREHWICYEIMGDVLHILAVIRNLDEFHVSD